ncbi:hypothetical protein Cgig2_005675 [Carnegiea gigantea]|uniref:Surfeit locus protein 6 n=1 Tax=Carnegiea gigantea TaxID=171969 RepID=A0A9Q1KHT5_9CARY|nr:hypothetical protein Cgig2_005675 [Carnegiea gigantea]
MKKRKQTPTTKTTTGDGGATTSTTLAAGDIKTLIRDYATFFDDLVDRIPAKFYLPTADENKAWYQGLSKAAKAVAKQKSIENTKKARRDRLDPEKSTKTTEILKETLENESKDDDGGDGRSEVTLEDLHQRLQKRIAELRAARGGVEGGGRRREADRREKDGKKRKREDEDSGKKKEEKKENGGDNIGKEVEAAAKGIEFGKVKLGAELDDVSHKKKKKKKLSKEEELKRALELEAAKKDPEKGEVVAKKHAWKAATERAMGKKVHDNPKLLKQSLQKEKRKHKKSIEKWKKRDETTQKMKQEKQEKRKENIKAKIDRKKQMKIEKREKKLMRPGFEGRKEGFVNAD